MQKMILHEEVVEAGAVVDSDVVGEATETLLPTETLPTMTTRMAIGKIGNSLLLRVHLTRLMGKATKGAVGAMLHPVVLSVAAGEAVSAMGMLEKKGTTMLVGLSSAVVELDVGTFGMCCVALWA